MIPLRWVHEKCRNEPAMQHYVAMCCVWAKANRTTLWIAGTAITLLGTIPILD